MNWYLKVLSNYVNFSGRANRAEYWYFFLFNMIVGIVAIVLDSILGLGIEGVGYGPIYILYMLATFLPGLAVTVRRLHDTGKSGLFVLLAFIPCIGVIALLVMMVLAGDQESNQYGPVPSDTP